MVTNYVTKNSAPRNVFYEKLKSNFNASYVKIFYGSGVFIDAKTNEFDALVVDEAHRLK